MKRYAVQSCDAKQSEHEQLKQHIDAQADMLMHPNTVTHIRIFHFELINTYINKEQL